MKFAIIVSRFNIKITQELLDGALWQLKQAGFSEKDYEIFWVPGAVEIPLIAKKCAKTEFYNAIICLGAVIRGETPHFDYVCQQVSQGCLTIGLEYECPVIFGVLTADNLEQAMDRIGGRHGHKGKEAAQTAIDMISLLEKINV